jgi:hypothetical protein
MKPLTHDITILASTTLHENAYGFEWLSDDNAGIAIIVQLYK